MSNLIADLTTKIADEILKQPGRSISPSETLISSGLIDSFSLVDLSIMIEENYGVLIDDSELNADTFDTIEALAAIIESRR